VLRTVICLSCQTGREATKAERALPASVAPAGEVQRDGSTSPSLPVFGLPLTAIHPSNGCLSAAARAVLNLLTSRRARA
jgi:hypothetical protein